ncbi:MAG: hypothetical protein M1828_000612 [Chrysothrix sp. TS-e1954]|nr:MAG: hypothetical protein M1828_000612 [Chrysothrix sp. TS-e1954]
MAVLVICALPQTPKTATTLPTAVLTICGYIVLMIVSYQEHTRSEQPSTTLTVYLGLSLLFDITRVPSYCVKVGIFVLELIEKRRLLKRECCPDSVEATSSVYTRSLFCWLNPLFVKGFKAELHQDSLPSIDPTILSASQPVRLTERWKPEDVTNSYLLMWTCIWHLRYQLLAGILPRLACVGFTFAQPFLIEQALDLVNTPGPKTNNAAYGMIGAYAIVYIGIAVSLAVYEHKTYRALTMLRGRLITLIYDKALRKVSTRSPDAEAITLMSADVDRIGESFHFLHEWYACLIELALALWLIYRYLGVAMAAPTAWVTLCTLVSLPLAASAGNAQVQWLEAIEVRLASTATWLRDIKALRMAGLAEYSALKVADLRSREVASSLRYRLFGIFLNLGATVSTALTPLWAFGTYVLLSRSDGEMTLTPGVAFATLSLLELQQQPISTIVDAFEHFQTLYRCFERIQDYLVTEERVDYRQQPIHEPLEKPEKPRAALSTKTQSTFNEATDIALVEDVQVWGESNQSPILKHLDFRIAKGSITMILGPVGSGKSTLLRLLLGEIPKMQGSVYASFGTAAYCSQSPWITNATIRENILGTSAMDEGWYHTVVDACALAPDFEAMVVGDQTMTGTGGARLSGGQRMRIALARALYARTPVLMLDDVLAGLDSVTENAVLEAMFGPGGLAKRLYHTVVLATHSDHVIMLDGDGRITKQGPPRSCKVDSAKVESAISVSSITPTVPTFENERRVINGGDLNADTTRRTGDLAVYTYFIRMVGCKATMLYLLLCAAYIATTSFSPVWLQRWTNANAKNPNERTGYWLGIYGGIAAAAIAAYLLSDCLFRLSMLPDIAVRFHKLLLTTTTHATTSFLTSIDTGNIMNRFSQDLELVDNDLPTALDQTILQVLSAISEAVLVCIGSQYLACGIPVCIMLLYAIQFCYLRTSRQLRLLDIEAKAPIFTQFLETLDGLASIRAFGWVEDRIASNRVILNESQRPYYLLWCIQRWLTLVLDLFVAGLAIVLVATALQARTAYLGVALSSLVSFSSTLTELVTEWTQLETAIGAVNRIRAFANDTQSEDDSKNSPGPPPHWPKDGAICFANVTACYGSDAKSILKNINFTVQAGQKVAICGRTGSGKSSLVLAILRMLDTEAGQIIIDGVDIKSVPRQQLRKSINTVPQERFLLPSTIRDNLDPLHLVTEERINTVLEKVILSRWLETNGGLNAEMEEESLSHGQKHIFAFARAMLDASQVVLLDELTSSLDEDSEEVIQRLIHEEFQDRTVLATTHRLRTVLDFDVVLMLDQGCLVELGNPRELLERPDSLFHRRYADQA